MATEGGKSTLGAYLRGERAKENGGLHFIATPDTVESMMKVKTQVQKLLDIENGGIQKEIVTSEVIEDYESFADESMIVSLRERLRGKHVYLFSDPHGDYNAKRKLGRKINAELINGLTTDEEGNISSEVLRNFFDDDTEIENLISDAKSLNDKLLHDIFTLETIQANGAETTNLVMLAMAMARQDKPTTSKRQPQSFKLLCEWISNLTKSRGYVIDIDLHNPSTESNFQSTEIINLYTGWFIEECMKDMGKVREDVKISSADQGGDKKIEGIVKDNGLKHITVIKTRDYSEKNSVTGTKFIGDVEGQDILIHDDMLDTGGTLCSLLEEMLKRNPKSINIAITHGMFHGKAYEKLQKVINGSNGIIEKVYITDSINKENLPDYVKVIETTNIVANTIMGIHTSQGVDRDDNSDYSLDGTRRKISTKKKILQPLVNFLTKYMNT